jgi:nanoRNase/pAp phosphatase (c-di-AMP/oligoRNAs hydrolase)
MTRPTDTERLRQMNKTADDLHEIADKLMQPKLDDGSIILSAKQREELAALLRKLAEDLEYLGLTKAVITRARGDIIDRARAAADQLQPQEQP